MKTINITVTADDRKAGMSLGQLYGFVREAMAAGVDLETRVDITAGFRGQLQRISVAGQVDTARTVEEDRS